MTNLKNKKGFSLIELSIVILIIGIIIAGITQSSRLIRQFKLSSARTQTQSSPVSSIPNLGAWFETTLESSFDDAEVEDSDVVAASEITTWHDINPASSIKRDATGIPGTVPYYYANCINGLPCLRFDGADNLFDFDGTFLVGVDYTIFVVERRRADAAGYFIGSSAVTTADNVSLRLGYESAIKLHFGHGDLDDFYAGITFPTGDTINPAYLHTFVNASLANGASTFSYYSNGSATDSIVASGTIAMRTLTAFASASIGYSAVATAAYFTGDIGEIIFYTRALKSEERTAVEGYLLKKWGIDESA